MKQDTQSLTYLYNARNAPLIHPKVERNGEEGEQCTRTEGKMLKLYNLLADNHLQYLYPMLEKKNISIEGLIKLSLEYDFLTVMKKVCKMKLKDAVKLMPVISKYFYAECAAGRKIEDDTEVVKLMDNRSKKRLPRYEEDDELRLNEKRKKHKSIVISSSEVDPNTFQKPGYNPFELKYRNVNEFPIQGNPMSFQNVPKSQTFCKQYTKSEDHKPYFLQTVPPLKCISGNDMRFKTEFTKEDFIENNDLVKDEESIKCEKEEFKPKVESPSTNMVPTTFRKSGLKSLYPEMINLSYPFLISKMNEQQLKIKAKLREERKKMVDLQNARNQFQYSPEVSESSDDGEEEISLNIIRSSTREPVIASESEQAPEPKSIPIPMPACFKKRDLKIESKLGYDPHEFHDDINGYLDTQVEASIKEGKVEDVMSAFNKVQTDCSDSDDYKIHN